LALSNLAEAVGYQLPKLMPFSRDQVLFACGSDADQASGDQASVWLVVVPKRRVADALATLGIPLPENPITMRRPPRAGETLEWSWRLDSQREGRKRLQTTLWWGLAAIWIVAGALTVYGQQRDFTSLEATHDELRREAAVVGQIRERLDLAQQQLDGLLQKRQQTITPLQLLNELTETLDDATWLTNVELQDDKLSLQGVSPTPAALIETLEDTALLRDVQFDAAITQAAAGEGRRFNISARLASADPEGLR
jgi:general secretion pathway protein L